jgi:hypothetical protein
VLRALLGSQPSAPSPTSFCLPCPGPRIFALGQKCQSVSEIGQMPMDYWRASCKKMGFSLILKLQTSVSQQDSFWHCKGQVFVHFCKEAGGNNTPNHRFVLTLVDTIRNWQQPVTMSPSSPNPTPSASGPLQYDNPRVGMQLPSMCKALGLIPSTVRKQKKKKKKKNFSIW